MFDNMTSMFGGMFQNIAPKMCKITMNGNIAVKCSNGYKTYNVKKGTLTNVTNFCFDGGDECFFAVPTNKVKEGDIILIEGKPKCVIKTDKKIITVIDYENSEIRQIIPERHVFMGNVVFYSKIMSPFSSSLGSASGMKGIMKMAMMSKLFSNSGSNGMGNMFAMSMFMNDGDNIFSNMFDGIDFASDDEEDDDKTEEEE